MTAEKVKAFNDFFSMIYKSWSWNKMTEDEKDKFKHYVYLADYIPTGTYKQTYRTLSNYYQFYTMPLNLKERK